MALTHNSKLADDERPWGEVDKTKLPRQAFADVGEEGQVSTWRFPHHWVQGGGDPDEDGRFTTGTMYLHRGGLNAAWAAAQGARSGQPAGQAVQEHLERHRQAIGAGEARNAAPPELSADVPDSVMVARTGQWKGHPHVGTETVTPAHLAAALDYFNRHYAANQTDLVIDYHHASAMVPILATRAPAAGWITNMELRAGGTELWGRVMWTTEAHNQVAARQFRYLSPVLQFGQPDRVTGQPVAMFVSSVALTNTPFMTELAALNANAADGPETHPVQGGSTMDLLKAIGLALGIAAEQVASQLGLAEAQEDKDVANAVMGFVTRAKELEGQAGKLPDYVANSLGVATDAEERAVKVALMKLRMPTIGLASVRAKLGLADDAPEADVLNAIGGLMETRRKTEAEELVDKAIAEGRVPPAQRDWFLTRAMEDLETTREVVNSQSPITDGPQFSGRTNGREPGLSDADRQVARILGHDEKEFAEFLAAERA